MESQIRDFRYSAAIRTKELEKRIAHLEHLVGWLTGLIIDLVAIAFGIAAAIFVAGDYYRLSSVDGAVVFAFLVGMLSVISFAGRSRHGVPMTSHQGNRAD
ncbi:MAG: hypothetical protein WBV76_23590, partial [Pseudolabrys sp.]